MQSEERSLLFFFFFLGGSKNETTIHRAQQNNRNYRKESLEIMIKPAKETIQNPHNGCFSHT